MVTQENNYYCQICGAAYETIEESYACKRAHCDFSTAEIIQRYMDCRYYPYEMKIITKDGNLLYYKLIDPEENIIINDDVIAEEIENMKAEREKINEEINK